MSRGIQLSEKHGVNPSVEQCFFCMKDVGVVLFGRLKPRPHNFDPEAPRQVCFGPDSRPCDECIGYMEQGIILISVDEEKTDDVNNPWRSGGWCVVKEEAIKRMKFNEEEEKRILDRRVAWLTDEVWEIFGLPRGEVDESDG